MGCGRDASLRDARCWGWGFSRCARDTGAVTICSLRVGMEMGKGAGIDFVRLEGLGLCTGSCSLFASLCNLLCCAIGHVVADVFSEHAPLRTSSHSRLARVSLCVIGWPLIVVCYVHRRTITDPSLSR